MNIRLHSIRKSYIMGNHHVFCYFVYFVWVVHACCSVHWVSKGHVAAVQVIWTLDATLVFLNKHKYTFQCFQQIKANV